MEEDKSSKGLLTTLALLFLAPVVTKIVNGGSLLDFHIIGPGLIAIVLLLFALVPSLYAKTQQRTDGGLGRVASDARVWLALFSLLWVYFAVTSLIDRSRIVQSIYPKSETALRAGWPSLSSADISDLADDLREYQPDIVYIVFDDNQEEALVLNLAKAMQSANWPDPSMTAQRDNPVLGIKLFAGHKYKVSWNR